MLAIVLLVLPLYVGQFSDSYACIEWNVVYFRDTLESLLGFFRRIVENEVKGSLFHKQVC